MDNLKEQLAPGWSPVNIGLVVVLFILSPFLAVLMIAYIVFGKRLNLDLGNLSTFSTFAKRLGGAAKAAIEAFKNSGARH